MARTAEQNAALTAATRSAVQTAAVRVFARHGYAASAIRDIALEAGVSIGTIYRHYPTKDAVYGELLDQALTGLIALTEELSGPGRPIEVIRGFTAHYLSDLTADDGAAEFLVVINQAVTAGVPAAESVRVLDAHRSMWRAFETLIRRGQEVDEFGCGEPAQLTTCYFAMLGGLTSLRLRFGADFTTPDIDVVLRLLTEGRTA
ncbi:TetR/AcrR family transcriptional regulator [Rhodococcus tibetensis]|uniref:TetR/AcrR family transcriptional regulator n=1 Tax=Rhodococcus tibetensis TaxID=2965064 RepID=A0ABT1Q8A7_9NOCA|nr:TetR/AcrR family transcriptional regulator [Rhodococcus sp. FXJ9.536]MCQ4118490.1 TetR/AcrR family transcriptional regulator [Rhodococcus sp. FXJ9.536]